MEKKFLDESTLTYLRNYIDGQDKVIYNTAADLVSSTHLESLTRPATQPDAQVIPSITPENKQQNLTIGDGLEIKDGALTTRKYVEANPTETGATNLTSLKVNGEVFNIPSGGSGSDVSVFDLTPYFDGAESIGTEGYNALKDYLANNKCPMVRLDLDGQMYVFNVSVYDENSLLCSLVNVDGGVGGAVGGEIIAMQFRIQNSGKVTISQAQLEPTNGIVEQGTMNLKGLKIGTMVYNIPTFETYTLDINNNTGKPLPLKILACETTTEGKMFLRVHDGNIGVGHSSYTLAIGFVYKQLPSKSSGYISLFTTNDGTFAILTGNAEYSVS